MIIRITIEHLNSQAVTRVEYVSGDTDAYDLETGELGYTLGKLFITFVSGKTYEYDEVRFYEFGELMTSVSKGRYINEHIKPFKACRVVETETVSPKMLDFGGYIWERVDA